MSRAFLICARFTSGRPYTASASNSGQACGMPYHCSQSAGSLRRKSAARSMSFTPASSSARAWVMATPLGVAENTTSQAASALAVAPGVLPPATLVLPCTSSGALKARPTWPRRLGNMSATGLPASPREVMTLSSTCGCWASRRNSSTPVYPVPPMMPTLIIEKRKAAERGKWVKDSAEPWRESCNYYWRIGSLNEFPAPENPFLRACALPISAHE